MPAIDRPGYGDVAAAVGISAAAFGIRLLIDPLIGGLHRSRPASWRWRQRCGMGARAGLTTAVLCYLWGSLVFMEPAAR